MWCAPSHVAPQQEQELHAKRQVKKEVSFPSASVPATAKTSDVMDDDGSFRNAPGAITELEVIAAQDLWAASIKRISAAYLAKSDFVKIAGDAAGELYATATTTPFKPTKAADFQFRPSAEEAMSYFIGGRHSGGGYDEDGGFAINAGKGFKEVVFENHQISLNGNTAIAMGNYSFTCATTSEVAKVEYTFGYKRCGDGKVRIFLHHSSLPYQPHSPPVEKGAPPPVVARHPQVGDRRRADGGDPPEEEEGGRKSRSSAAASDNVEEDDDEEDEDYDA